jgi:membrane protease YdiL (CAAX protease family)
MIRGWDLALEDPKVQAPLVIVIQILWWGLVMGYIYFVVTVKYDLPFASAIGWIPLQRPAMLYLLGGVLLSFAVVGISTVIPKPEGKLPIELLLEDRFSMILIALFGVFIAPVTEEIVFRGFIYRVFEQAHGVLAAVLMTSAAFSLVHGMQYGWRWQNLLLLFGVGLVFGLARAKTGSVLPSTLIHASYNATLFGALLAAGDQVQGM